MDDGGVRWVRFHLEVVSKAECGGEAAWRWVARFVLGSGSCKTTAGEGEVVIGSNWVGLGCPSRVVRLGDEGRCQSVSSTEMALDGRGLAG